jgi:hypothetical protein
MLHHAHDQPCRYPAEDNGEQCSRNHDVSVSVAGKADGVARVMCCVVKRIGLGEAHAKHQRAANEQAQQARDQPL